MAKKGCFFILRVVEFTHHSNGQHCCVSLHLCPKAEQKEGLNILRDTQLSKAEAYIMQRFWQHGPLRSDELAPLVAEKGWKTTTLLTFLSRLAAKDVLHVQKQGKANLYLPCITEEEYRRTESEAFLQQIYGGSAKNFLAALVDSRGLSRKDLDELRHWLNEQEVDDD
jgi:predicted transcriptional regulator